MMQYLKVSISVLAVLIVCVADLKASRPILVDDRHRCILRNCHSQRNMVCGMGRNGKIRFFDNQCHMDYESCRHRSSWTKVGCPLGKPILMVQKCKKKNCPKDIKLICVRNASGKINVYKNRCALSNAICAKPETGLALEHCPIDQEPLNIHPYIPDHHLF